MNLMINNQKIPIEIADTFIKRLIGLMGKKNYRTAILLKNTKFIHTFGMKMNIDVLYLDKECHVIQYFLNVKPNRVLLYPSGTKHIIELDTQLIINKDDYINVVVKI